MEVLFIDLFKIDVTAGSIISKTADFIHKDSIKEYIQDFLTKITNAEPEREYEFESEYTEVRATITKMLDSSLDYSVATEIIANRLLREEVKVQADLDRKKLDKDVQRGMLIIALMQMTTEVRKLIISKVDYDEFILDSSGDKETGISTRRKVYKAFICDIDNESILSKFLIFDTNSTMSVYWWRDFLELSAILNDTENTKRAFSQIEKNILLPLKKKFKPDFFYLRNMLITEFRTNPEFNGMNLGEKIDAYTPISSDFPVLNAKQRIIDLSNNAKYGFDLRFNIERDVINKRVKQVIKLTDKIDLIFLENISTTDNTVKVFAKDGEKYVAIKSEEGYDSLERMGYIQIQNDEQF